MVEASLQPLAPRYYLSNFEQLCATVEAQYGDVLAERELHCLRQFESASLDARCLFVRLVSRRGPLFRVESLDYPELDDLAGAVAENLSLGLFDEPAAPAVADLMAMLRRSELAEVAAELLPVSGRERKRELSERLAACDEQAVIAAWREWREANQRLVEVSYRAEIELFQILFFGNGHQTLTEFVLSDLGIASYHRYPLDRGYRLFDSRAEIDDYLTLRELKARFKQAAADADVEGICQLCRPLMEPGSGGMPAAVYRDELRNRVARQLERLQQPQEAGALYRLSGQHPARERQARLLTAAGDESAALELCEAMAASPWCEAEMDFARRQIPALRRTLNRRYRPLKRDRFEEDLLELAPGFPVEIAAARYYSQQWEEVHYVENLVINGSFGLAFWEQIFEPVPGAFINPFQSAPLDMYSRNFYAARKASIEVRFAELAACRLEDELLATYDRYAGLNNRWVSWRGLPKSLLKSAIRQVPRAHWLACWRRILFDPQANRNGCPDLIALDEDRGYCLIEVKGPGDQLQLNQRRWLRFFQREKMPARVARVRWSHD
jgi:hypothetical protein